MNPRSAGSFAPSHGNTTPPRCHTHFPSHSTHAHTHSTSKTICGGATEAPWCSGAMAAGAQAVSSLSPVPLLNTHSLVIMSACMSTRRGPDHALTGCTSGPGPPPCPSLPFPVRLRRASCIVHCRRCSSTYTPRTHAHRPVIVPSPEVSPYGVALSSSFKPIISCAVSLHVCVVHQDSALSSHRLSLMIP